MARRWNPDEDEMLIALHSEVGANFLAQHDLGRPYGAGAKRLKHLDKTGASVAFYDKELANIGFMEKAGHYKKREADWLRDNAHYGRNAAVIRHVKCQT